MIHNIVYISPSGTTEKVVLHIKNCLEEKGFHVNLFDYSGYMSSSQIAQQINNAGGVLWAASPVYVGHPLPQIMEIIELADSRKISASCAVATWGGVTSGLAAEDFCSIFIRKEIPLAALGIFPSRHSSMWGSDNPICKGRPDEKDFAEAERLVSVVIEKLSTGLPVHAVDPEKAAYQGEKARGDFSSRDLAILRKTVPVKKADPEKCTKCGICIKECPVGSLSFKPWPEADEKCILCNRCVISCPENAFPYNHEETEKRLTAFSGIYNESKEVLIIS